MRGRKGKKGGEGRRGGRKVKNGGGETKRGTGRDKKGRKKKVPKTGARESERRAWRRRRRDGKGAGLRKDGLAKKGFG